MSRRTKQVVKVERVLDVPEEELAAYRESFNMFDKDGSGSISYKEIIKIMKNFGYPMSKAEVDKMIKDFDEDGDGEINFEEFVSMMKKTTQLEEIDEDEEILRAFKAFDYNNDGKITNFEFKYILKELGFEEDRFKDDEVARLFLTAGLDENGDCKYQDFINFWKQAKKNPEIIKVDITITKHEN